jgi:hypothetical protein
MKFLGPDVDKNNVMLLDILYHAPRKENDRIDAIDIIYKKSIPFFPHPVQKIIAEIRKITKKPQHNMYCGFSLTDILTEQRSFLPGSVRTYPPYGKTDSRGS